ncbi:MAG: hypothetical protein ACK5SX_11870, partial [Sandaracinobacter sp.]
MTSISREKFYEMVWAKPLGKVGGELGISSFKVVEICAAMNVPRPIAGHWNKLAAGKPVPVFPLPEPMPGEPLTWTAGQSVRPKKRQPEPRAPRMRPDTKREAGTPALHPLIRGAKGHFLKTREVRDEGYLKPYKYCLVDVRVSKACLDRALALASNLFNAFGASGCPVSYAPYRGDLCLDDIEPGQQPGKTQRSLYGMWSPDRATVVKVGDVHFGVTIIEMTEEVLCRYVGGRYVRESEYQASRKARYRDDLGWTTTHTLHTGRLKIVLYSPYRLVTWQQEWIETTPGSLDPKLKTIIRSASSAAGDLVVRLAEAERPAEIERQKREAEWERWKRRDDARNVEQSKADIMAQLKDIIADWTRVIATEQFFSGIERHVAASAGEPDNELQERLRLARSFIGTIDQLDFFRAWKAPS